MSENAVPSLYMQYIYIYIYIYMQNNQCFFQRVQRVFESTAYEHRTGIVTFYSPALPFKNLLSILLKKNLDMLCLFVTLTSASYNPYC